MKCQKCTKSEAVCFCGKCNVHLCISCVRTELIENHEASLYYFCQECEESVATKFCYSCDQHLCQLCNSKIHNKGKRAQHQVEPFQLVSRFRTAYVILMLGDVRNICQSSSQLFLLLCQRLPLVIGTQNELSQNNVHLFVEQTNQMEFEGFSLTKISIQQISDEFLTEYCKYFPMFRKIMLVDTAQGKAVKQKLTQDIGLLSLTEHSNISFQTNVEQRVNISTSTQNQSISKGKKPPIAYFQFYKLAKEDKRSEVEQKMRRLANQGTLILRRKEVEPIEDVVRSFIRTVGDSEVQYCSLEISYISVQSLIWVIRSIKQDCMAPGEKLILSRIKECFDIKLHSRFWQSILNYLSSGKYQNEYDRGSFGFGLPKILIAKQPQENLLLLKGQEWAFEDHEKLDDTTEPWKEFVRFLLQYFQKNKSLPGGRYGCVQFVKTFGPEILRGISLGKLSLYVQEAINQGIIRYHKTLLVRNVVEQHMSFTESSSFQQGEYSFNFSEKSLYLMQRDLKIRTIQSALINILLQNQPEYSISLAQIPLFLKKSVSFNFNLQELGFPKLKNFILTLNQQLNLDINKSTLNYSFTPKSQMLINMEKEKLQMQAQDYLKVIVEMCTKMVTYYSALVVDDLLTELNTKLGFEFEYRVYNVPDFNHFLYYFCSETIHIEFISGVFMAYTKQQIKLTTQKRKNKENPETSTPNFCNSSFTSQQCSSKITDFFWHNPHSWADQKKEEMVDIVDGSNIQKKQLIETIRSVERLLDDDDGTNGSGCDTSTIRTVVENPHMANNLEWSLSMMQPIWKEPELATNKSSHLKSLSGDLEMKKQMIKHNRATSNINTIQRKN